MHILGQVSLLFLLTTIKFAYLETCSKEFVYEQGKTYVGTASQFSESSPNVFKCVRSCLNRSECRAVHYQSELKTCSFLSSSNITLENSSDSGNVFVSVESWVNCVLIEKQKSEATCAAGWREYHASCYYFATENFNWAGAMSYCRGLDASLVEIEGEGENTYIQNVLQTEVNRLKHWIGLTDEEKEGVWKWASSGTVATYFNWFPGQPNNGLVSNYGAIWSEYGYSWVDEWFTGYFHPLCERSVYADIDFQN